MKKMVIVATLRDGDNIQSDEQEIEDKEFGAFKEALCEIMKGERGYLSLVCGDTTFIVGRQDVTCIAIREV